MIADYLWLSLGYKNAAYAAESPTKCGGLDDVDGQVRIHIDGQQGNKKHIRPPLSPRQSHVAISPFTQCDFDAHRMFLSHRVNAPLVLDYG